MRSEIRRAGLKCKCGAELLVVEDKIICQICNKEIKPAGMIEAKHPSWCGRRQNENTNEEK